MAKRRMTWYGVRAGLPTTEDPPFYVLNPRWPRWTDAFVACDVPSMGLTCLS